MLSGLVKGGTIIASVEHQQLIHSGGTEIHNGKETSNNDHISSVENASNGIAAVSLSFNSLPKQTADPQSSSESYCAVMVSLPEKRLHSFLQHVDSSVVAAALSVVCALVNHDSGKIDMPIIFVST